MNNYPKLHNATWPGIVGKGPDSEPPIPFDTMLEMTDVERRENSRLSCQIIASPELDGLILYVPEP